MYTYKGYFLYYMGESLKQYNFEKLGLELVVLLRKLTMMKATKYMGEIVVEVDDKEKTQKIIEI